MKNVLKPRGPNLYKVHTIEITGISDQNKQLLAIKVHVDVMALLTG